MLAYLFLIVAVAFRFIPHPFTFTPVIAALLYFGARQPRSRLWVPLLALIGSDVALTRFHYDYPLSADHFVTWGFYAAVVLFGGLLKENANAARVAGASLASSITFFIVSNFAVWAVWNMYPKTLAGLGTSYVAALPFFRNGLLGDLLFSGVFFGLPVLLGHSAPAEPAKQRTRA